MSILSEIKSQIPANVQLVAVSKTQPIEALQALYGEGQRIFGENKAQELKDKAEILPQDIEWHFIGHLQSNKVKYIAPFIKLIHAVDSLDLLQEINKQAAKNGRIIDCLLQFKIAVEETKFGLDWESASQLLAAPILPQLQNIRLVGVMGMGSFTDDEAAVRIEFQTLKSYFERLKSGFFANQAGFKEISMGMSGDYPIAIEEGSTMVRIGTLLFGERRY
jgi:PLP dependent protein